MLQHDKIRGKVKWFSGRRGFGFIVADDGSYDVFVHYTNIVSERFQVLTKGQCVEFNIRFVKDKPMATNVVVIS